MNQLNIVRSLLVMLVFCLKTRFNQQPRIPVSRSFYYMIQRQFTSGLFVNKFGKLFFGILISNFKFWLVRPIGVLSLVYGMCTFAKFATERFVPFDLLLKSGQNLDMKNDSFTCNSLPQISCMLEADKVRAFGRAGCVFKSSYQLSVCPLSNSLVVANTFLQLSKGTVSSMKAI